MNVNKLYELLSVLYRNSVIDKTWIVKAGQRRGGDAMLLDFENRVMTISIKPPFKSAEDGPKTP